MLKPIRTIKAIRTFMDWASFISKQLRKREYNITMNKKKYALIWKF